MPGRARQSLDPRSVVAWVYLKLHDAGSRTEPVRQSFEVLAAGGLHAPGASDPASPMGKIDAAWACIGVHGQKSPLDLFFAYDPFHDAMRAVALQSERPAARRGHRRHVARSLAPALPPDPSRRAQARAVGAGPECGSL